MGFDAELLAAARIISAFEDFRTFIENDPSGFVSVDSAIKVTVSGIDRLVPTYLAKDYGINFFNGNFIHEIEVTNNGNTNGGICAVWAMANTLNGSFPIRTTSDLLGVVFDFSAGNPRIFAWEADGGTLYFSAVTQILTLGQKIFLRIKRDENVGAFGTLDCQIYTDPARTVPLSTLTLTLHTSKKDYRNLYVTQADNAGTAGQTISCVMEKLELVS